MNRAVRDVDRTGGDVTADLRQRIADALHQRVCSCGETWATDERHVGHWLREADAVLAVLREAGTVEYRVVCADGKQHSPLFHGLDPIYSAENYDTGCRSCGPHRMESRAAVTLPWTAVET